MNFRALLIVLNIGIASTSAFAQGVGAGKSANAILASPVGQQILIRALGENKFVSGMAIEAIGGGARWAQVSAQGAQAIAKELLAASQSSAPRIRMSAQQIIGHVQAVHNTEVMHWALEATRRAASPEENPLRATRLMSKHPDERTNEPQRHVRPAPKRLASEIKRRRSDLDPKIVDEVVSQWTTLLSKPTENVYRVSYRAALSDDTRRIVREVAMLIAELTQADRSSVFQLDTHYLNNYLSEFTLYGAPRGFVGSDRNPGILASWVDEINLRGSGVGILIVSGPGEITRAQLPRLAETFQTGVIRSGDGSVRALEKLFVIRLKE